MKNFLLFLLLHSACTAQSQTYNKQIDFNKITLQFEDASAELKPEYMPIIYRLADSLKRSPNLHLTIRGHVCCIKKNTLAKKRAKVVRNYLSYYGVNKNQMTIMGMRNSVPVVFPEKTKEDELANMRVDFILK